MNPNTSVRIVAYVDILGWKHAFNTIGHEGLVEIATKISEQKATFSPKQKDISREFEAQLETQHSIPQNNRKYYDISFSFFSDCFAISSSPDNLDNLFNVTKWACIRLLGDHGLLTRGGITMGEFTHDMAHDITVGIPLNNAVDIEKSTKMPRIKVADEVVELAKKSPTYEQLIYDDGECRVLNIANDAQEDWLQASEKQIAKALNSELGAYEKCKWKYISEHLPRMKTNSNRS
jgi:hypothetical protein